MSPATVTPRALLKEKLVRSRLMLLLALALVSASCKISSPSNNQKETFSGTLQPSGRSDFSFNVNKNGEYQIKVTALNPSVSVVGIAFGTPSVAGCVAVEANSNAILNVQALGDAISPGAYCGVIYDVGALTTAVQYTVEVSHP